MKKNFEFRSGTIAPIQDVLDGKVPEAFEYAPITYYRVIGQDRLYDGPGTIHVTNALNGTREEFLQNSIDYNVSVDRSIYLAFGLSSHGKLERGDGVEQKLSFDGILGTSDLCSMEGKDMVLSDYKFVGSYKITTTLGVEQNGRKTMFGADGKPMLYQRNGKGFKKGDEKTTAVWTINFSKGDHFDYTMQGNMYRVMFERQGTGVDKIKFWFIPRDGGTQSARQRGVENPFYYVELPRMDDEYVLTYFRKKRDELSWRMVDSEQIRAKYAGGELDTESFVNEAVKLEIMPPVCSDHERWYGRKCKDYCDVAFACQMVGDNKASGTKKNNAKRVKKEDEFADF